GRRALRATLLLAAILLAVTFPAVSRGAALGPAGLGPLDAFPEGGHQVDDVLGRLLRRLDRGLLAARLRLNQRQHPFAIGVVIALRVPRRGELLDEADRDVELAFGQLPVAG